MVTKSERGGILWLCLFYYWGFDKNHPQNDSVLRHIVSWSSFKPNDAVLLPQGSSQIAHTSNAVSSRCKGSVSAALIQNGGTVLYAMCLVSHVICTAPRVC